MFRTWSKKRHEFKLESIIYCDIIWRRFALQTPTHQSADRDDTMTQRISLLIELLRFDFDFAALENSLLDKVK